MTTTTFFLSKEAFRNLKSIASHQTYQKIKSSHLSESIATALGFKTYAALQTKLKKQKTIEVPKPNNQLLIQRLNELGYANLPQELKLLPNLTKSYTPLNSYPLRKKKGIRWYAWRNLIVSAINAGLDQKIFGLSPKENWWNDNIARSTSLHGEIFRFKLNNKIPAVAIINESKGDELSLYVILNPRTNDLIPEFWFSFNQGDAYAHCWLERKLGAWIHDGGETFHCRRVILHQLANLKIEPSGYSDQGIFFL